MTLGTANNSGFTEIQCFRENMSFLKKKILCLNCLLSTTVRHPFGDYEILKIN